jgi:hypothetical protein
VTAPASTSAGAFLSRTSDRLNNPYLDAAFSQDDLRSLERSAPDRIAEIGLRRVKAGDASVDDRASAIDAREERRGQAGAGRRHATSSRLEDHVALCVLHPDEPSVARMALLKIAHPRRKGVAGRDFRTVAGEKDRADFAHPVWAQRSGAQSRLNLGAGRRALAVHVDLTNPR